MGEDADSAQGMECLKPTHRAGEIQGFTYDFYVRFSKKKKPSLLTRKLYFGLKNSRTSDTRYFKPNLLCSYKSIPRPPKIDSGSNQNPLNAFQSQHLARFYEDATQVHR